MNISGKVYSMIEMDGLAQAHVSRILAAMDIAQQLEWAPGLSLRMAPALDANLSN